MEKQTQHIILRHGIDEQIEVKQHGNTKFCLSNMKEINPVKGCEFQCKYCNAYTQEKDDLFSSIEVFVDYPSYLEQYLNKQGDKINNTLFYYSPKTDCFQDILISTGITSGILRALNKYNAFYFLLTKGKTPPEEIIQLLKKAKERCQVIISCSMPTEKIAVALEPGAPPIDERFKFAEACVNNGIFTTAIFSPIFPFGDMRYVKEHIDRYIAIGIRHFRLDFAELSNHGLNKLCKLIPEHESELRAIYNDPDATLTHWKVPFRENIIERHWPSRSFMKKTFYEFEKYLLSVDNSATASICNSLCSGDDLDSFNKRANSKGICCIGAKLPKPTVEGS